MNKKVLGLTITLLIVTMMATPMVGTVQAKKTTETFTIVPNPLTPTLTLTEEIPGDMNKFSGDGHMLIRSGTQRTYDYDGVLGEGTLIQETIISISHVSGPIVEMPPPGSGIFLPAFGYGGGIYRIRLEITVDGGYGTGSLEGILNNDWEWDFTTMPPYVGGGPCRLKQGTDDFAGVKVDIEWLRIGPFIWFTTTTITTP